LSPGSRMRAGESETIVLDSYALLAYFQDEPGANQVEDLLERASRGEVRLLLTVVNLGEVAYVTERTLGLQRAQEALAKIEQLPIQVVDVDKRLALEAAHLKARYAIAYADCFALALARIEGASLVTGDPEFECVRPEDGVPLIWIRKTPG